MENLDFLKGCGAKEHIKKFLNKGWGLRGLDKIMKKLLEADTTIIDEAATLKACRNLSCSSIL